MEKVYVQLSPDKRLIVWDIKQANRLHNLGFYGRPLGISKPKEEFNEPLILDPIEGLYLAEEGLIKVSINGKNINSKKLAKILKTNYVLFDEKYRVYRDLRHKGFIITPGIKYGCDFAVYENGPGIDHAPYIVQILLSENEFNASDIVKSGRLATTVRKSFIIAVVNENIKYIEFNWWKA